MAPASGRGSHCHNSQPKVPSLMSQLAQVQPSAASRLRGCWGRLSRLSIRRAVHLPLGRWLSQWRSGRRRAYTNNGAGTHSNTGNSHRRETPLPNTAMASPISTKACKSNKRNQSNTGTVRVAGRAK